MSYPQNIITIPTPKKKLIKLSDLLNAMVYDQAWNKKADHIS